MRYADPHACPDCRGPIAGQPRCPACGFDLTSVEAAGLWRVFQEADHLLAVARGRATTPQAGVHGDRSITASAPPASAAAPSRPARSWSTGSLLLALGAACLVVAGIIFVTVAWGALGILGRALILLAVTALIGAVAVWATRRHLRGTAESLWAVFLAFLAVDWIAADAEGLFGRLEYGPSALGWGALVVAAGVTIVLHGRKAAGIDLLVPELAVGGVPWIVAPAFTFWVGGRFADDQPFWSVATGAALVVVVVVVARRAGLDRTIWVAAVPLVLFAAALVTTALAQSRAQDPRFLVDALPMLTLVAAAVAVATLRPALRVPLAGAAGVGLLWLAWDVADDLVAGSGAGVAPYVGLYAVVTIVVGIAWFVRGGDGWSTGVRWAGVSAAALVALVVVMSHADIAVDHRFVQARDAAAGESFWIAPVASAGDGGPLRPTVDVAWWALVPVFVALLAVVWAVRSWRRPRMPERARAEVVPAVIVLAAGALVFSLAMSPLPYVVFAWVVVFVAVTLALVLHGRAWPWALPAPALLVGVLLIVPAVPGIVAAAWGAAAVGLSVVAVLDVGAAGERRIVSVASTGLGAAAALGAVDRVLAASDPDPGWHGVVLAAVSVGAVLLAMALEEFPLHRAAGEAAAALGFAVALGTEADDGAAVALILTIGAAAAALVGLLDEDRGWFRWVALALIGAAWVVRLAASHVDTVEAYTAPFAVALLAAGWWRLRTDPPSRSWVVLTPGLTLALLPSLPQAVAGPTGLRALLLGLVAAGILAAGVALRWGAPVVAGATVIAVLLLVNLGPTAAALPRWMLIAITGLTLLAVGTTWEKRVAEGRAVVSRIAALR